MTHFTARFPQHAAPSRVPRPQDYLDAAEWYRRGSRGLPPGSDLRRYAMAKAEALERVYRQLQWGRRPVERPVMDDAS